ncbi:3'-phosphatase, 5'-polynucleotide kinase [Xanthomonas phage Xp12]|uniref:3'-phosphatase, 5'-polynucleotide kinase n=1 Tax=Xanthomonas phage Xp12 TaxID=2746072 RepID=A0A7G9UT11_9CAUD|nr:3'-phosphatase, 5'-polynucleotide kinase [Xanthomonas phage Xp12]QNN97166.1 3'-phosphatase, 5'-polynucleotide kinase [Xanthomonas phage Xp12]UGL62854.1 3'-phosphatase, 5'-polynucleotide kinase [Xanthomonas phage MET13-T1]
MNSKPLYIFDLDGTLATIDHRRHLVESDPKQWREFYAACDRDTPCQAVIRTANALHLAGADVWVWSGRSDEVADKTSAWLLKHLPWLREHDPFMGMALRMRFAHDHQPDVKLKRLWLSQLHPDDRARLVAVFDDRKSVVDMWRAEGVPCFQVAPGDF